MIDIKELIKAGVHFGHQTSRWCPKMEPYIWGFRQGVHLIDVSKTAHQLEKAAKFLEEVATQSKPIFWVGTKKSACKAIEAAGKRLNMPNVTHRWIGGSLTNYAQVKKAVTKLLYFEDILSKSSELPYTKKELNTFQKMADRLRKNVGGITSLTWPIGAVVIIDVKKEQTALKEAIASNIPVVALIDTNSDPSGVQFVIPGNDDSPKSIELIVDYLAQAAERGRKIASESKASAELQEQQQSKIDETVAVELSIEDEDEEESESTEGNRRKEKQKITRKDKPDLRPRS